MPPTLLIIPLELKLKILESTHAKDVERVRHVCKELRGVVDSHQRVLANAIHNRKIREFQDFLDYHDCDGLSFFEGLTRFLTHKGIWQDQEGIYELSRLFSIRYFVEHQGLFDTPLTTAECSDLFESSGLPKPGTSRLIRRHAALISRLIGRHVAFWYGPKSEPSEYSHAATWTKFHKSIPPRVPGMDWMKVVHLYNQVMAYPGCLGTNIHPVYETYIEGFNFVPLTFLLKTVNEETGVLEGSVSQAQLSKTFGLPFPALEGSFSYQLHDSWAKHELQRATQDVAWELDVLKRAAMVEEMYIV